MSPPHDQTCKDTAGGIHRLDASTVAQIKSSIAINDLIDVVIGLLENSLDAGANIIDVSVDFDRGGCTVDDDGEGILPRDFKVGGGLGLMHHTSKSPIEAQHELHGKDGIFLASLASMSLLSVTSKHTSHFATNQLLLHRGHVISRRMPSPFTSAGLSSTADGTRVTVRNLFGNMPVRVKHRATSLASATYVDKEWQRLLKQTTALLLAWPTAVTVNFSDAQDPTRRKKGYVASPKAFPADGKYALKSGNRSKILRAPAVLTSSGLLPKGPGDTFLPAYASSPKWRIRATFSTVPQPDKRLQFISLEIRPILSSTGDSSYYDVINKLFDQSKFGLETAGEDLENDTTPTATDLKTRVKDFKAKRKGIDRWPVFYVAIERKEGPLSTATDKVDEISQLIEAMVKGWLRSNKYLPEFKLTSPPNQLAGLRRPLGRSTTIAFPKPLMRVYKHARPVSTSSEPKRRRLEACDPSYSSPSKPRPVSQGFADWSRIKTSSSSLKDTFWSGVPETPRKVAVRDRTADVDSGEGLVNSSRLPQRTPEPTLRDSSADREEIEYCLTGSPSTQEPLQMETADSTSKSEYFVWPDPHTGEDMEFSKTTGMVRSRSKPNPQSLPRKSVVTKEGPHRNSAESSWLSDILSSWHNPVFGPPTDTGLAHGGSQIHAGGCGAHTCDDRQSLDRRQVRLSTQALRRAEVVAQVDRKYILVKMPSSISSDDAEPVPSMLVLVDQHAASERIILEDLIMSILQPVSAMPTIPLSPVDGSPSALRTTRLTKPFHFAISDQDSNLLRSATSRFAQWGILYDLSTSKGKASSPKVAEPMLSVTHLPPAISERCTQEPRLLIELLREDIYNGGSSTGKSNTIIPSEDGGDWVRRMGGCPKGIVDMLNSRACRSAIMFNDELTKDECRKLIEDLAKCTFSFMCAHGRVSMVPLVKLEKGDCGGVDATPSEVLGGVVGDLGGTGADRERPLAEDFMKWK